MHLVLRCTVKLGLYIHGLERALGYYILSVNHGHRQSENMYIFLVKTYRMWQEIRYYVPIFSRGALFGPFFGSFSEQQHVIHCLSVSISIPWYVFKLTML